MQRTQYEFERIDSMIITEVDGARCLIDLGCPITTAASGRGLPSFGRSNLPTSLPGLTTDVVGESLNTTVDCLVGTDLLSTSPFVVDWPNNKITFFPEPEDRPESRLIIPIEFVLGLPVLKATIDGEEVRLGIDTGSKITYLANSLVENLDPTGLVRDFHYSVGDFEENTFHKRIEIEGTELDLEVASMPRPLSLCLEMAGLSGLLGNDILEIFPRGYYDLPNLQISFGH